MSKQIWLDEHDLSTALGIILALDADQRRSDGEYRWVDRARALILKVQAHKAELDGRG